MKCFWCEKGLNHGTRTKDHSIPKCIGGDNSSIVDSCRECNNSRAIITSYHCLVKDIENKSFKSFEKTLEKLIKKINKIEELVDFWHQKESSKLGHSPSKNLKVCERILNLKQLTPIPLQMPTVECYWCSQADNPKLVCFSCNKIKSRVISYDQEIKRIEKTSNKNRFSRKFQVMLRRINRISDAVNRCVALEVKKLGISPSKELKILERINTLRNT